MQPFLPPCRHHIVHIATVSRTLCRVLDGARAELVTAARRPARDLGGAVRQGGAIGALMAEPLAAVSGLRLAGAWAVPGLGGAAGLLGYLLAGRGAAPSGPPFDTDGFTLRRFDVDAPMGLAGRLVVSAAARANQARDAGRGLAEAAWTAAAIGLAVGLELVRVGLDLSIIAGLISWAPLFAVGGAALGAIVHVCGAGQATARTPTRSA